MLEKQMTDYFNSLDNLMHKPFIGLLSSSFTSLLLIIVLFIFLTTFITCVVGSVSLITVIFKPSKIKLKYGETLNRDKADWGIDDYFDAYFSTPRMNIPIALLVGTLAYLFFSTLSSYNDQREKVFAEQVALIETVFSTYLETCDTSSTEILKPKESVTPSKIESNTFYVTSFNIEGVQYNDKVIYVTYSDRFPTDTLVSFNASLAKELLPTRKQRSSNKSSYAEDVLDLDKYGVLVKAHSLSQRGYYYVYLDEIDYIYNIKVEETNDLRWR